MANEVDRPVGLGRHATAPPPTPAAVVGVAHLVRADRRATVDGNGQAIATRQRTVDRTAATTSALEASTTRLI